jgi:myo-inositol-1(or 4)-monophosphatase
MRGECFQAVIGQGAFLHTATSVKHLAVSQNDRLVDSLLATGFPYDRHHSDHDNVKQFATFLKRALGIRRAGSTSLDLSYVAAGRLDGYWEYKLSSWDVAAGLLLVQEANGQVSDMEGEELLVTPTLSLVASNGLIQNSMVSALSNGAGAS